MGFGTATSAAGGLTISNNPTASVVGATTNAVRLHGRAAVEELPHDLVKGDLDA